MSKKLLEIAESLKIFQDTYPEDTCLILTDREIITSYMPGKNIDLKLTVGESMTKYKNSVTYQVLQTGKKTRNEVGSEHLGVAYISTATPIIERGEMVGVLAAVTSNQKLDVLRKGAHELNALVQEMISSSEEITESSDRTAKRLQALSGESEVLNSDIKNVETILNYVKNMASRTQILGLNAAIEAARSGQYGRGFSIVADEIKKMAVSSKEATEEIQTQLNRMQQGIEEITLSIRDITSQTGQHSTSAEEFHLMVEKVAATASLLNEHSSFRDY
ncbi:methyl-accepting chemotaxis protein (MCP) signaling protein [Aneurinibacillus soli]|uniref:Putative sensory transducer protein YfmS n=1 Tax=Aneurinibacillus soli TaxID=1500254 RepID=A0A0U5C4Y2_9BACL|nr:methyl-accepting chemotaxis protein [Aneurinibacillus soli]PYE60947.1 methyl-accepting chemotaxis protein (MCP) signaling protein [Aneurinibacillus soli]BAU26851.1 putative sensory transducer protein YfmS [Aneurinibacillus soli]